MAPRMHRTLWLTIGLLALAGRATAAIPGDVYTDNVVIILDGSGSMGEPFGNMEKIAAAKNAIRAVLKTVPASTQVGLLVFSDSVRTDWVFPLGPRDDAALLKDLDRVQAEGSTPLGEYLKKAADHLLAQREKQLGYGTYRLLVVTDGEATDQDVMERNAPEIVARGLGLDVIGVDMRARHTLARLAHSYRTADDPAALKKAIAEVLAEVSAADSAAAGQEAFDLLAPIPDEVAAAMLAALARANNRPIGDDPGFAGATAPAPDAQAGTPPPTGTKGRGAFWFWIFVVVAAIIVFRKKTKKGGGK